MHKHFTLNGISFQNSKELIDYSKEYSTDLHDFLGKWFDDSDLIEVKSSGSTGKPKPIQIKKMHMINSAKATGSFFNLPENTTALICLPIKYIAGKMMFLRALTLGWETDMIDAGSDPLEFVEKKYDFSAMVPLQVFFSLAKISLIKKLIVGGGDISHDLQDKIQQLPTRIYATYGMTETITHIAVKPLNIAAGLSDKNNFYKTLPGVEVWKDKRDCLVIKAPNICDGRIITNDIVDLISDREFIWLGRYDNIINSGGVKLIPEQIEKKLSELISQRFFISSQPDDILGEKVILVVEGQNDLDLKSQISGLKKISKFEIPKEIYFVDRFILTETGKIQRKDTLELLK